MKPGIYDMTDEEYHADPCPQWSLSNSGIKKLLDDYDGGCPARYIDWRENPGNYDSPVFMLGRAAHSILLGGPKVVDIGHDDYRTKAAKEAKAEAEFNGFIPLKKSEYAQVIAMTEAVKTQPGFKALFRDGDAKEQTLIWQCESTGVWCRAKVDAVHGAGIITDYKTCASASPHKVQRAMRDYGYDVQAAWYLEGARAVGLFDVPPGFAFFFQEKKAPYLTLAAQPGPGLLMIGQAKVLKAKMLFADCLKTGKWPGYNNDKMFTIEPSDWEISQFEGHTERGDYDDDGFADDITSG